MANAVQGKDVILSMLVDADYIPVMCATDCSYNCSAEFIEKTGPNSGGAREWMRRLEEHTSSVSGLTKIDNSAESLSFFYMLQVGIRRVEQTFKLLFEDEDGNDIVITGPGLIGTMSINGPATDFSQGEIEIRWNGEPSMTFIDPPGDADIQDPLYITVVAGETSVFSSLLQAAGVNILEVQREGIGHDETSGTPGNRQFHFTAAAGTVEFDTTNPFNTGEVIYILYEI